MGSKHEADLTELLPSSSVSGNYEGKDREMRKNMLFFWSKVQLAMLYSLPMAETHKDSEMRENHLYMLNPT